MSETKFNIMTHEKKINYMRIACGIVGFVFKDRDLDMLVSLYDLVLEKQGNADLKMVCDVESNVDERASKNALKSIPKIPESKTQEV